MKRKPQPQVLYQIRMHVKDSGQEPGIAFSTPDRFKAIEVWKSMDVVSNWTECEQGILAEGFVWLDFVVNVNGIVVNLVLSEDTSDATNFEEVAA